MNKTVTIHICGVLFHIEEEAYNLLNTYLDAIRNNLGNSADTSEIINDIELRIAELLVAKRADKETVIVLSVVQDVIEQLGAPETISQENDYEEEHKTYEQTTHKNTEQKRRIYRDEDKGSFGGVCAGLANYFRTEVVYIRLLFVLSVIFAGIGILPYIILWIVIPSAKTPEEKAHMYGEEITLDGIKKKFHEEKGNLKETFERVKKNVHQPSLNRVTDLFESLLHAVIKILKLAVKLIGAILIYASIVIGIAIIITVIFYYSKGVIPFISHQPFANNWTPELFSEVFLTQSSDLNWIFFALIILISAICLALFNSGLKLGKKANTKWLGYVEFPLFIAAIILLFYHGIMVGTDFEQNITTSATYTIDSPKKQLYVTGFTSNKAYDRDYSDNMFNDFILVKEDSIYNQNVKLRIKQGDKNTAYVEVTKRAHASTDWEAVTRTENIAYDFLLKNDTVVLANTFKNPKSDKMRGQEVRIDIYLPLDYTIGFDNQILKFYYRIPFEGRKRLTTSKDAPQYCWTTGGELAEAKPILETSED